jgi:8-oxo-dGTP diphosphatase
MNEIIRTADVVCIRGNEVLLIERGWPPHQGMLALPGGHVDLGETSRAAAARELQEETGVRIDAADLVHVGTYDAPGRDPRGRYVTDAYLVTVPDDTTATAADDAAAVQWVPLPNATSTRLAFDHSTIVADTLHLTADQRPAPAAWPTPEAAYALAPSIISEIGWVTRAAADPETYDPANREYWLRKAAALDRIALRDEPAAPHADATEAAEAVAVVLLDNDKGEDGEYIGQPYGPGHPAAEANPRSYVRQEYAHWWPGCICLDLFGEGLCPRHPNREE